jgi:hypothetical protein
VKLNKVFTTEKTENRLTKVPSLENVGKISIFELNLFFKLNRKGHELSRNEQKILQLELWLKPARAMARASLAWSHH